MERSLNHATGRSFSSALYHYFNCNYTWILLSFLMLCLLFTVLLMCLEMPLEYKKSYWNLIDLQVFSVFCDDGNWIGCMLNMFLKIEQKLEAVMWKVMKKISADAQDSAVVTVNFNCGSQTLLTSLEIQMTCCGHFIKKLMLFYIVKTVSSFILSK